MWINKRWGVFPGHPKKTEHATFIFHALCREDVQCLHAQNTNQFAVGVIWVKPPFKRDDSYLFITDSSKITVMFPCQPLLQWVRMSPVWSQSVPRIVFAAQILRYLWAIMFYMRANCCISVIGLRRVSAWPLSLWRTKETWRDVTVFFTAPFPLCQVA